MKKKILYGLLSLSIGLNAYYIQKKYAPRFSVLTSKITSTITGKDMTGPRELTPQQVMTFYQLMKDAHEVLTANNIPYIAESGTLLGSLRHGGMIPWDDDLDISIPIEYEMQLQAVFSEFEKLGYFIDDTEFTYKVYTADPKTWSGETKTPPFLDIFITRDRGDGHFVYSKWKARKVFDYAFPPDSFTGRKLIPFGDIMIYGPANPEHVLDLIYPKGWKDVAYLTGDHLSGTKVDKTQFHLKKYEPAKPFGPLKDRYKK